MFSSMLFGALLLGVVSARSIDLVLDDEGNIYLPYVLEEGQGEQFRRTLNRVRRQSEGKVIHNLDGSAVLSGKAPLAGNGENTLSAIGIAGGNPGKAKQTGFGIALDNVNGHGFSLTKETLPFGDKITGAGRVNLLHNDNHDLTANAFVANTRPSQPSIPNFNTYGGGVDYKFHDKVGASLGMSSTPFLDRQDYSLGATANLYKSPSSSLDFGAGFNRIHTPHYDSGFQPNFGLSYGLRW